MELRFAFTVEEINLVLGALSQLPYHQAAPLIKNIEAQALNQMTPPDPAREAKDMSDARP
jgi:hypothetical protein